MDRSLIPMGIGTVRIGVVGLGTGISADGLAIVGFGASPGGFIEGWVATVPELGTVCLLAMGGSGLLRRRGGTSSV